MMPAFFSDTKSDEQMNEDIVRKADDLGEDMLEEALARDTDTIPDVSTEQFCLQSLSDELEFQRRLHLYSADMGVCSVMLDASRYCSRYDILALDTMSESIVGSESLFPGTEGASEWLKRFRDAALRLLGYIKEKFFDLVNIFKNLLGIGVKPTKDIVQQTVDEYKTMALDQLEKMSSTVSTIQQNTSVPEVTEQNKNAIVNTFVRAVAEKIDYNAITDYAGEIEGNFLLKENIDRAFRMLDNFAFEVQIAYGRFLTSNGTDSSSLDTTADKIADIDSLFARDEYKSLSEAGYTNPSEYADLANIIRNKILVPNAGHMKKLIQHTNKISDMLDKFQSDDITTPTRTETNFLKCLQTLSAITTDFSRILKMVGMTYLTIGPRYNDYVKKQATKAMNGHAPGESSADK